MRVYNLDSFLETLQVDSNMLLVNVHKPSNADFVSSFDLVNKEENLDTQSQQVLPEFITNTEDNFWLDSNHKIGAWGENIASDYLKGIYGEEAVKIVSDDAKLGYDISVTIDANTSYQFEVKVAFNHLGFHITANEIKKAALYNENYFIFFIMIDSRNKTINASIINNPYRQLFIEIDHIYEQKELININIVPNKFYIQLKPNYYNSLEKNNLHYLVKAEKFSFNRNDILNKE